VGKWNSPLAPLFCRALFVSKMYKRGDQCFVSLPCSLYKLIRKQDWKGNYILHNIRKQKEQGLFFFLFFFFLTWDCSLSFSFSFLTWYLFFMYAVKSCVIWLTCYFHLYGFTIKDREETIVMAEVRNMLKINKWTRKSSNVFARIFENI
jgi:hypothetical protein